MKTSSILVSLLGLVSLIVVAGCESNFETGYGRASGPNYSSSINGTRVLHEIVEEIGHPVDRYTKLSPRWDKYQTVFWIPDAFGSPSEQHINWIENWLTGGGYRTVVYVARDYDATVSYWEMLMNQSNSAVAKDSELRRQFHQEYSEYSKKRDRFSGLVSNSWFELESQAYQRATQVDGILADGIEPDLLDIRYGNLPRPGVVVDKGEFGKYEVNTVLKVDGQPMVYTLHSIRSPTNRIIIVGNASFLLNLPLANPANRDLASSLVWFATENQYVGDRVLFIESDDVPPILDRDIPETHSTWSWITKKPLRYIVPNILFCSLLFCFVYFPIFGRAKITKPKQTSNFRDHIDALGKLIKRTKSTTQAESWIQQYRRMSKGVSKTDTLKKH